MGVEEPRKIQINAHDPQVWSHILQVFNDAAQEGQVPKGDCYKTVMKLVDLGFGIRVGQFRLDFPSADGELAQVEEHTWALDADNNVVELAGDQFNNGLTPDHQFHGPIIIPPDHPLYGRYQPLNRRSRDRQ